MERHQHSRFHIPVLLVDHGRMHSDVRAIANEPQCAQARGAQERAAGNTDERPEVYLNHIH